MKTLICDNGGYRVYVETLKPAMGEDVQLRFLTQYTNSKDPDATELKFSTMLSPEQRALLKSVL